MVIKPDPTKLIDQIIAAQKFDYKKVIDGRRIQPFDFFRKSSERKANKTETLRFNEALKIINSYLFTPTPVYLKFKLRFPIEKYQFPKNKWFPVDPQIIPSSHSPVVMVFAPEEEVERCIKAGADYAGSQKLVAQVKKYGMIPVDDCFCELKYLSNISKLLPVLGSYSPNIKKSTAIENVAMYINAYKKWNYIEFIDEKPFVDPQQENKDTLVIELETNKHIGDLIPMQLKHISEIIRQCSKISQSLNNSGGDDDRKLSPIKDCVLYAKNAPKIDVDILHDFK